MVSSKLASKKKKKVTDEYIKSGQITQKKKSIYLINLYYNTGAFNILVATDP